MLIASAVRVARQDAVLALVAGAVVFGQALSLALAGAEAVQDSPSLVMIEPAATVTDAPTETAKHGSPAASEHEQGGNPLSLLPLSSLSMTRERPIFSPSRRPAPPPGMAAPYVPPASPPQPPSKPIEPDRPLLTLSGTLAGGRQGVGIFVKDADKTLRLKTGEYYEGWILRSIHGGEATFQNGERTATLAMALPGSAAQSLASPIPLGNMWRDGDGQVIAAPQRREPKPASPKVTPLHNTWLDGDGQMIGPPPRRPPFPAAVAPAAVDPVM
jgi:general secretion pathway protein N